MSLKGSKYIYVAISLLIVGASLFFTNTLSRKLAVEERKKMEIWAEAMNRFNHIEPDDKLNFELIWQIIESNRIIPAIIADQQGNVINYVNIDKIPKDTNAFFKDKIVGYSLRNTPIELILSHDEKQYIYYDTSILLKYLDIFPYVQLSLITGFLLIIFWAFASDKKAEQNRVWVGLSKETAHQLGTPISSLLAWEEILKLQGINENILSEISKDINRLQTISERFSKIGSAPVLNEENIVSVVENAVNYLRQRTSNKVNYYIVNRLESSVVSINIPLFEWVVENLCKNAVDAMGGIGDITFTLHNINSRVTIDISDTGKGIAKAQFKEVFKPGFTTKQRGWGLGLSLSKRIIENYHNGKIFVRNSELGKGTTFRIVI
ncbi:histidine kinase [Porphyromonadaceae bacterium COT-184 OH4590]|nr:histidine kinase [Porphyromonadaceae bacterium COT-184 OH4590]MDO4726075.1 HAMP domain-containing sensor histidine kinase [Porphyromonadaceae bacterium]